MRIRLRNRCDLPMRYMSEPQQHKDMTNHRVSINWRSGSKKTQFLTSLMTISVRKAFFTVGRLPGHAHINQTYPDVVWMWRQFNGCPASVGRIDRVFFAAGKTENSMMLSRKKICMDKTLESTLKTSTNTKLLTCDDKGVFTDDDDTYRKRK